MPWGAPEEPLPWTAVTADDRVDFDSAVGTALADIQVDTIQVAARQPPPPRPPLTTASLHALVRVCWAQCMRSAGGGGTLPGGGGILPYASLLSPDYSGPCSPRE